MNFVEFMNCSHQEGIEELIAEKKAKGETEVTDEEICLYDLLASEVEAIEEELRG